MSLNLLNIKNGKKDDFIELEILTIDDNPMSSEFFLEKAWMEVPPGFQWI